MDELLTAVVERGSARCAGKPLPDRVPEIKPRPRNGGCSRGPSGAEITLSDGPERPGVGAAHFGSGTLLTPQGAVAGGESQAPRMGFRTSSSQAPVNNSISGGWKAAATGTERPTRYKGRKPGC